MSYAGLLDLGPSAVVLHVGRRCSFVLWSSMSEAAQAAYPTAAPEGCWVAIDDRNGPGHTPSATTEELRAAGVDTRIQS